MEDHDPTEPKAPEADDLVVAIWGTRRPPKSPVEPPPPPTDIWGRSPTPAPPPEPAHHDAPDPAWPDLWGEEGWRGEPADGERRHGPLPAGRFALPEWWAATPKPRPSWKQRLHRK